MRLPRRFAPRDDIGAFFKPIEIAKQYANYEGISFDEEMTDMFNEIVNMVNDDARNEK